MKYDPEKVVSNIRANLKLDLPEVRPCKAHGYVMSIAGGGPSISDTKEQLTGYICAINGSLAYLLDNGITPDACGVVDPGEHIADAIVARPDVHYYVASQAHPKVFEKLKGCHVIRWHASGQEEAEALLQHERPDDWFMIGGGSTMGVRWLNLGHVCGFRKFHVHGLDSSYRDGNTHAYPDHDRPNRVTVDGFETSPNFTKQVHDFFETVDLLNRHDPIEIEVHGSGLLQSIWRRKWNPPSVREIPYNRYGGATLTVMEFAR